MYANEIDMYPDIIEWLKHYLSDKYSKQARKITVIDTHDSDLLNFITQLHYQSYFPEYTTYKIRQDITGFVEYDNHVDLVFVECKNTKLSLIHLSQLLGYSCIAEPQLSILLSPQGMGSTLSKLLLSYRKLRVLEFRPQKKIYVLKWDEIRKDIDHAKSIVF